MSTQIDVLRGKLSEQIIHNRKLQQTLLQQDIHIEQPIVDKELIEGSGYDLETLQRKLEHALEVQTYHTDKLERKVRSVMYDGKQKEYQQRQMLSKVAGDYLFLRQQWLQCRQIEGSSFDDRIDRLNKVVAALRGKMSNKLAKEQKICLESEEERLWLGDREFLQVKERFQKAKMQKEEALLRLSELIQVHRKTKQENQQLTQQLKKTKDRLKAFQTQYLQTCKRQQQLNERLSRLQTDVKKNRVTYQGPDYLLEITKEGISKVEITIMKELEVVRKFLESTGPNTPSTDENTYPMQLLPSLPTIPKLNFEKRFSLADTRYDPQILNENCHSQNQIQPLSQLPNTTNGARFCRTNKNRMRNLHESLSQRSFYTKLHQIEGDLNKK